MRRARGSDVVSPHPVEFLSSNKHLSCPEFSESSLCDQSIDSSTYIFSLLVEIEFMLNDCSEKDRKSAWSLILGIKAQSCTATMSKSNLCCYSERVASQYDISYNSLTNEHKEVDRERPAQIDQNASAPSQPPLHKDYKFRLSIRMV